MLNWERGASLPLDTAIPGGYRDAPSTALTSSSVSP